MNIAIDGPAGAGKSTIAKTLAKDLGFVYVDTGAMYRAMGIYFIDNGISINDKDAVTGSLKNILVEIRYEDGAQKVILNGTDVSARLRDEAVGNAASVTSAYPEVRTHLMDLQRGLAKKMDVIMDGRDIGTVVLPDAELKIFLTASSDERARRRCKELEEKGEKADFEKIKADIEERDYRDSHRETAPLKQAEDAVLVDTSDLTIDEVVSRLKELAGKKRNG
ncbi:MAG: (d)CMP kinase [Lachnospiraceae bacterium]|nr:(d)CMP kinase [Lachnospiraceae bacterium]